MRDAVHEDISKALESEKIRSPMHPRLVARQTCIGIIIIDNNLGLHVLLCATKDF